MLKSEEKVKRVLMGKYSDRVGKFIFTDVKLYGYKW
jgi:hypothetical protein